MDETDAQKALARTAWIDDQMRRSLRRGMFDTIRAGIAAGIGTTCSTIFIGLLKYAAVATLGWLGAAIRF